VIAKNEVVYREMAMLFEKREVKKIYHAMVNGSLNVQDQKIVLPLGQTAKGIAKVDKIDETIHFLSYNNAQKACLQLLGA
jgi:23S rRNA pseudouridine955/2504/2580 synthase